MLKISEMTLHDAGRAAAGNWQSFDSFVWCRESSLRHPERWTIVYIDGRDSDLLAKSNAQAIRAIMEPFTCGRRPDVFPEHHQHWLSGYVEGFAIRVYKRDGSITNAFRTYFDLMQQLADYPCLDEEDYSRAETDATIENIHENACLVLDSFRVPDGWEHAVYRWLWDHDQRELDSVDDRGGSPSQDAIRSAMIGLGYPCLDDQEESV